ncbi:hypothetical protein DITRI_Ditri06bG0014900 [Diplodiscus trichospermus]
MAIETEEEEIMKPRSDKRDYRRIVLGNSLQVLLISDRDTDKSAACMYVSVGSFSDPDGLEGVAHLLIRVLPYSSEKYPLEDGYSKYVSEHGGCTNSTSSLEWTTYYFDINNDCFEEALERFSQFFIKPLISTEATMRKIKTVDSVYQNNILSDGRRMFQLGTHFSMESHPFHRFGSGNWSTLDTRPKAKGLDIRRELLKFYEENYSANLMHLVVYTKESIDKIQILVENKFQDVPSSSQRGFQFTGLPFSSEHLMILVKAVPVTEGHKLKVTWPITPSYRRHHKEGPCKYLAYVIRHEGEGSVFYILNTLGWATGLAAGEVMHTSEISFFEVTISLTDAGHDHMQNIIGLLFKYIQHLKESSHKRVFDELSAVSETEFHYHDQIQPFSYVQEIASKMQKYPPKYWLVGSSWPTNFNPDIIQMYLTKLTQENVRIFWWSKKFEGDTDKVEPWYGTAYSVEKVTTSMIQKWMSSAPNDNLQLPAPNMFIPTNLSLRKPRDKIKFPVLLRKSSYSKLWYKPDTMFSMPKAFVRIEFNCPHTRKSAEDEVLAGFFVRLLKDYLKDQQVYQARVAGHYYAVARTEIGFLVTVFGYNDKLNILLKAVIDTIANFEVNTDRFCIIKEMKTNAMYNHKVKEPSSLASEYSSLIMKDIEWPWKDKHDVLPHSRVEDLVKFTRMMFSGAFLECFIAGNMECEEAIAIIEHVEDIFFKGSKPICQPCFPISQLTSAVVKFERGMSYLYSEEGPNPDNENSALLHHIQSPREIDLRVEAFLKMLEKIIHEMTNEEFKSNVKALIDMKMEKHKNLWAESVFYWGEITNGTLKFDRREAEAAILRDLTQQDFIDFFDEYIKVGSPRKKTLSVRIYGKKHLYDYKSEKSEPLELNSVRIEDILGFRRSQPHYGGSFKGFSDMKL